MFAEYEPEFNEPAPDTISVPPEMVVVPLNVLTADNVNEPEPDFVNVPVDVAIGSATTTSPVLASSVRLNVPVIALPDDGSIVKVPRADSISAAAANVTRPVIVFAPLVLRIAPPDETPAPLIVTGSASSMLFEIARVAPSDTLVAPLVPPSAEPWVTANVPCETVVTPVYVPEVDNVSVVPTPTLVIPPVPVIVPLNVVLPAVPLARVPAPSAIVPCPVIDPTVSELLAKFSDAPDAILTGVSSERAFDTPRAIDPVEFMVVVPEYVLLPDKVRMPVPPCVRPPVPEMTPRNSVDVEPEIVSVPLPRSTYPVPSVFESDATFSEKSLRSSVAPSMISTADELSIRLAAPS